MSKNNGKINYRRAAKGKNRPNRPERHISVRSIRREPHDPRPLGRAAVLLALQEVEAERAADANEAARLQGPDATDNSEEATHAAD